MGYFTDHTRFTALTTFCDGIYFQNIIRLLAIVYVANGCLLSKMATQQRRSTYDVSVKTLYGVLAPEFFYTRY